MVGVWLGGRPSLLLLVDNTREAVGVVAEASRVRWRNGKRILCTHTVGSHRTDRLVRHGTESGFVAGRWRREELGGVGVLARRRRSRGGGSVERRKAGALTAVAAEDVGGAVAKPTGLCGDGVRVQATARQASLRGGEASGAAGRVLDVFLGRHVDTVGDLGHRFDVILTVREGAAALKGAGKTHRVVAAHLRLKLGVVDLIADGVLRLPVNGGGGEVEVVAAVQRRSGGVHDCC